MTRRQHGNDNYAIDLHDADISKIVENGAVLRIELDVCVHCSKDTPGVDSGTCWLATANMSCGDYTLATIPRDSLAKVWAGTVTLDDTCHDNVIPAPLHYEGNVRVSMELIDGTKINVSANSLDLAITGEMEFLEDFP